MKIDSLLDKALNQEFLSAEEGVFLFQHAPTSALMFTANELRKLKRPDNKVTWIIDRNVNTTNGCIANCKFCNFYRIPGHPESYITTIRSEEHTSELQSLTNLVCRLLLEKKKPQTQNFS